MDADANKAMEEQFSKLPPELQKVLKSPELPQKVNAIGQRHQLHIDQMGKLRDEVVMFLMGFSEPQDFLEHLVSEVGVTAAAAGEIATDVSTDILIPIQDSMKASDGFAAPKPSTPMPPPAPATPPPPPAPAPKAVVPPAPASTAAPKPPVPATLVPKPAELHPADVMLTQKTVTVAPPPAAKAPTPPPPAQKPAAPAPGAPSAPAAAPQNAQPNNAQKPGTPPPPKSYSADPYREPIEP